MIEHLLAVAELLDRSAFRFASEAALQAGIGQVLAAAGIPHRREVQVGPAGRLDFLTDEGLAIEVKVDGTAPALARQVLRYAQRPEVHAVLIVTTRAKHHEVPPEAFGGKPGRVHFLLRSAL